ncbi:Ventricular zone-expressed PH domain-containing protein [Merluccius polli]|uniref:Ventricular zone-expressed PH domain-containing protein n=1 Tax=Merluccius polli TaxID=89951 RepID=A0AA47N2K2_MERPO|nr:Ventricular zone-expressed PH domain-containing protein [Merluccius polli]
METERGDKKNTHLCPWMLGKGFSQILEKGKRSNHMLLRVLPSVYPKQPDAIHRHLGDLTAMMSQLEPPEQLHLIRLLQMVAEQRPLILSPQVPALVGYLGDPSLTASVFSALVDVSQASPSSLVSCLPTLRSVGQQSPALLGSVAKIHGAVGIISEAHACSSLVYLVSLLGNMEHSFHHTLLMEIRALTDRYPCVLGGGGKDIYRMSNSFSAIARLLERRLEESPAMHCSLTDDRTVSLCAPPLGAAGSAEGVRGGGGGGGAGGSEQHLQIRIQAFEEKMGVEAGETEAGGEEEEVGESPAPQRRYSAGQAARQERREMRFNRSKSLALHAVRSRSFTSDNGDDAEGTVSADNTPPHALANQHAEGEHQEVPPKERKATGGSPTAERGNEVDAEKGGKDGGEEEEEKEKEEEEEVDRLNVHLRNNMETIRVFCKDMMTQIPVPEQCVIEGRGCFAKLSFSCPLKGHYCLYAKSSFILTSPQPHLWIHAMMLQLQSKSSVALCSGDDCVQRLVSLWERTQLRGAHSFSMAMTQNPTLHKKYAKWSPTL